MSLDQLISSISVRGFQVQTDRYGHAGDYPIVDQGKIMICGYTDAPPLPCQLPVTVFGDHTREVKFVDFPFVVGADGTKVLEPSGDQDPRYLFALIEFAAARISNLGYSRHFKELRDAEVPYYADPAEQQRIAAVLDSWSEAISIADQSIELQEIRKKGLARRLFGDAHNPFMVDGEPLNSIATVEYGRGVRAENYATDGLAWVIGTSGVIARTHADEIGPAIVVGRKGTLDKPVFVSDDQAFAAIDTTFIVRARAADRSLFHYLTYVGLAKLNEASGVPSISADTLRALPIPGLSEHQSTVLDAADEGLAAAVALADSLRRQKNGLMQKLLTGEWRVPATGDAFGPGGPAADRLEVAE